MFRVTGQILRRNGTVLCENKRYKLIEWNETSSRGRTFTYLVVMQGLKYTRPVRLEQYEVAYWRLQIQQENSVEVQVW